MSYGPAPGIDHGRSVHQIVNGPLAGNFIAVGETPQPTDPTKTDVYVVVTNGAGARINEFSIDMANGNDIGEDFAEKENGNIVIVGNFTVPGVIFSDIFVLEFDPNTGIIVWANDYSGSTPTGNFVDEASDIEPVADGFVVSGRSSSLHLAHLDAILFKIDMNGAWRWGTAYDGSAGDDGFNSVTSFGDGSLVAGGFTTTPGAGHDIVLVRCNAFGTTMAAMRYGLQNDEGAWAVKACSPAGPNPNRIILAGNTTPGGAATGLLALVDINTMAWVAGRTYRTPVAGWTEATGVVETPAPEFEFVMSGLTLNPQGPIGRNFEFYLSRVTSNLNVVNWYRVHGGNLDDFGWKVDLATPVGPDLYSIIATGFRGTNAMGRQLDITRTTQAGVMQCDVPVNPNVSNVTFNPVAMPCQQLWGMLLDKLNPTVTLVVSAPALCAPPAFGTRPANPKHPLENGSNEEYHAAPGDDPALLAQFHVADVDGDADREIETQAFPNPVKRGSTFNLGYMLHHASRVELSISDASGKGIYQTVNDGTAGENQMEMSTSGWASGTYLMRMTIGDRTITRKIIVID